MFASIRRHAKWLWFIIVVLVIISFVFFFAPQQGTGGSAPGLGETVGSIDGEPITRDEYIRAYKEARLRFRLFSGNWPDESETGRMLFSPEREASEIQRRLFLEKHLEDLGVQVGDQAVAQWITEVFRTGQDGPFDMELYKGFLERIRQRGYDERDFKRFVQNEVGMQHLVAVYGLSGKLVPPQEAEAQFRTENSRVDTKAVFFQTSQYLSQVEATPEAIGAYYTNRQAVYRKPAQIQVSYVEFPATNYLAAAEELMGQRADLSEMIDSAYAQGGTNAYPNLSPEEAKAQIREQVLERSALIEAQKDAVGLMEAMLETEPRGAETFERLAAERDLEPNVTPPFGRFSQPEGLNVPSAFTQQAGQLTAERPYTEEPIVGPESVYVVAFKTNIASRQQSLEEVQARVEADFKRDRAQQLAREAGQAFHAALTNGLAQGKTFDAIAEEQGVSPVDLPPFSQQTAGLSDLPSGASLSSLKNAAFALSDGEASPFTSTADGGFVVYLEERLPVEESVLQEDLPDYIAGLRRNGQFEAFEQWLQAALASTPMSLPSTGDSAGE